MKELKNRQNTSYYFKLAAFITGLIGFALMCSWPTMLFSIPLLGIAYLLYRHGKNIQEETMEDYGKKFVEPMVREIFPDGEFNYTDDIDLDFYDRLGLIKRDSTELVTNHLLSNDEYELENFTLKCQHSRGKGGTKVTYDGTIVSYRLSTGINGVVRIVSSQLQDLLVCTRETTFVEHEVSIAPEKIETGSLEFDDSFEVYANDQHTGFYVLNAYVMEKLFDFRDRYGDFALAITPEHLYVAFDMPDKFIWVPDFYEDLEGNPFEEARDNLDKLFEALNDVAFAISKSTEKELTI